MKDNAWTLLAGTMPPVGGPLPAFAPEVLDFLADLSTTIRNAPEREAAEIAAFGFWCRPAHLEQLRQRYADALPRRGVGTVLHLAPSNVPTVFAYSLAIGLLAGNGNIVRLSGRSGAVEQRLYELIRQVLPRHEAIAARVALICYDRTSDLTRQLCASCAGRVVWGGDATVKAIRALPQPPGAVELCFPDRWSMAVLEADALAALPPEKLSELADSFYNDTYAMDQNACSSPQLVLWLGAPPAEDLRARWWDAVAECAARRYPMDAYHAARKLERFCIAAMDLPESCTPQLERRQGNTLGVVRLAQLPDDLTALRGSCGLFFEGTLPSWAALQQRVGPKLQTITTLAPCPAGWEDALRRSGQAPAVRVVPFGQALAMDPFWDGQDMIHTLSTTAKEDAL